MKLIFIYLETDIEKITESIQHRIQREYFISLNHNNNKNFAVKFSSKFGGELKQ